MPALTTFGETMLRLSPPRGHRLSRVDELDVHVGGAESNVAVAAANLGIEATWLSALPESPLGERVVHALRGEGVRPAVTWTDSGRVGTYYYERGGEPRGKSVVYDRTGTPIRTVTPADLPLADLGADDVFFTTGITAALSAQLAETTDRLLGRASDAGVTTAFDVNYREKLWDPAAARGTLTALFPSVDVLFVAERDARRVLECEGDEQTIARSLADRHGFETVVLTRGDEGALAVHDGRVSRQATFPTETVDPVGSGDAFAGGFLVKRMRGGSVPDALAYGAATAALKRTVEGDMALVSPAEVEAVVEDGGTAGIER